MTILETVLIFVGIPLAVYLLVVGLVYAPGVRRGGRYRPGRRYSFAPVWFVSRPEEVSLAAASGHGTALAVTADEMQELEPGTAVSPVKGGASGSW